ncbi:hypothetical protein LEP1GSC062_2295 [Leptospira alexanderi serovar Manhao 3 str. L 60]|uniref:Uncharacterized protein n=1 Tax=Leptospira alexanderi serovar Manhao 3 str. L 60 TaxID=1049759 RepID=V6IGE0_9LEPT|nr:hypothetical protein LEP1GSC062_2295 [Leptospira alexanderi serovar Manhao 3 str. L 60]
MRKNFLKVEIPTISEFVHKIVICGSYPHFKNRFTKFKFRIPTKK